MGCKHFSIGSSCSLGNVRRWMWALRLWILGRACGSSHFVFCSSGLDNQAWEIGDPTCPATRNHANMRETPKLYAWIWSVAMFHLFSNAESRYIIMVTTSWQTGIWTCISRFINRTTYNNRESNLQPTRHIQALSTYIHLWAGWPGWWQTKNHIVSTCGCFTCYQLIQEAGAAAASVPGGAMAKEAMSKSQRDSTWFKRQLTCSFHKKNMPWKTWNRSVNRKPRLISPPVPSATPRYIYRNSAFKMLFQTTCSLLARLPESNK